MSLLAVMRPTLRTLAAAALFASMSTLQVQAFRVVLDKIAHAHTVVIGPGINETPVADNSTQIAPVKPAFPRIAKWIAWLNQHYFVRHARDCRSKYNTEEDAEMFGCNLKDFRDDSTRVGQGREVHWNLEGSGQWKGLLYETYTYQNASVNASKGQDFKMPDFCSRAIVSELSTVYSRGRRTNDLLKAIWNHKIKADCSKYWPDDSEASDTVKVEGKQQYRKFREAKIFNPEVEGKSCWNLVADYRILYCTGYQHCATCPDGTDAKCHLNTERVQCCRSAYQDRNMGANLPDKITKPE